MDNFVVPPSTGPVVEVLVRNRGDQPFQGEMAVRWPDGWQGDPIRQKVDIKAADQTKVAFTLTKAQDAAANVYDVAVEVTGAGKTMTFPQRVVAATAPYLKPTLNGTLDEWKDMVPPIVFTSGGKQASVMTSYNRENFLVAVRVEEDALVGLIPAKEGKPCDAIHFAVAPPPSKGAPDTTKVDHWEFVVAATSGPGEARTFLLRKPGDGKGRAEDVLALDGYACEVAKAVVAREGNDTCYEVAIPLSLMPALRPTTGRLFCFSLLVYDGDGTGLRDLGSVMNLTERKPAPWAWCRWQGDSLEKTMPFGNDVEFGFCTSIH
jgi:hypothetical protein